VTIKDGQPACERLADAWTQVALLADAGSDAGLGHLSRSSALALALERHGVTTRTLGLGARAPIVRYGVVWEPASSLEAAVGAGATASAMVIDSYLPSVVPMAAGRTHAPRVVFHDGGPLPQSAELVISAGSAPGDGRHVLAGIRYACLAPRYATATPRRAKRGSPVVLVTTGGGATGALGASLAGVLVTRDIAANVRVVVDADATDRLVPPATAIPPQDSLIDELREADLAVCGGGQTSLEAAALGIPTVALVLADNQRGQASQLAAAGASRVIDPPDPFAAATAVAELLDAAARRIEMARAARRAVDGRGAARVAEAILRLVRR